MYWIVVALFSGCLICALCYLIRSILITLYSANVVLRKQEVLVFALCQVLRHCGLFLPASQDVSNNVLFFFFLFYFFVMKNEFCFNKGTKWTWLIVVCISKWLRFHSFTCQSNGPFPLKVFVILNKEHRWCRLRPKPNSQDGYNHFVFLFYFFVFIVWCY